jgi:hypothetical protein
VTAVSPDQALAIVTEGLAVLSVEKEAGGGPETEAQLDAVLDLAILVVRDIPDYR